MDRFSPRLILAVLVAGVLAAGIAVLAIDGSDANEPSTAPTSADVTPQVEASADGVQLVPPADDGATDAQTQKKDPPRHPGRDRDAAAPPPASADEPTQTSGTGSADQSQGDGSKQPKHGHTKSPGGPLDSPGVPRDLHSHSSDAAPTESNGAP